MPQVCIPGDRVAAFCRRFRVRRLSLFGSVLRDDFRPGSDVDVLVEFEPGQVIGLRIGQMEQELTEMLDGRAIDLRTPNELSPYFRAEVLREVRVVYGERLRCRHARPAAVDPRRRSRARAHIIRD